MSNKPNLDHAVLQENLAPYLLGELAPADALALREHLAHCPECRAQLADLSAGLAGLALSTGGAAPPSRSRERLLRAAHGKPASLALVPAVAAQRSYAWWVPGLAAALLGILAAALWINNLDLRRRLRTAEQTQQSSVQELARAHILMDGLTSPSAKRITLTSKSQHPQPVAHAMYMPHHHALAMIAENLPAAPPGKAYQLWMMPANGGAAIPSATFWPNAGGTALMTLAGMEHAPEVKGFAVTIEPQSGSATPTLPIVLSGDQ